MSLSNVAIAGIVGVTTAVAAPILIPAAVSAAGFTSAGDLF